MTTQSQIPQSVRKSGFTLIELLTVIAIIAILLAITIPIVSDFRKTARKTVDMSNLRQIANASLMHASDNNERLPNSTDHVGGATGVQDSGGTVTANDIAGVLAVTTGLNDSSIWVSKSDSAATAAGPVVVDGTAGNLYALAGGFSGSQISFDFVADLTMAVPPSTPLAFSRMNSTTSSTWGSGDVYGTEGGHIVFLGGNVQWYQTLAGALYQGNGTTGDNISEALTGLPGSVTANVLKGATGSSSGGSSSGGSSTGGG